MRLKVCIYCDREAHGEPVTVDESMEHLASLLEAKALLEALQMIHGDKAGVQRYLEVGGLIHMSMEEVRELVGLEAEGDVNAS